MNSSYLLALATLGLVACIPCHCAPADTARNQPGVLGNSFDISGDDLYNVDSNNILPYNPVDPKPTRVEVRPRPQGTTNLKSSSYTDLEREFSSVNKQRQPPNVANVMAAGDDAERSGSPNVDKIKDIAMNSREVRFVGPDQKEIEMKDDLPSKIVVALENLHKEAKEVLGSVNEKLDKGWTDIKRSEIWGQANEKLDKGWTDLKNSDIVSQASDKIDKGLTELKGSDVWSQVNEKLDKGWTDFKSMVEGVVSPSSKSG